MVEVERKAYLKYGHYVEMPIVFQVLFTPVELDVLNTLIHFADLHENFISQTMLVAYTGRDIRSIKQALRFLEQHQIIERGGTCQRGTHYKINNQLLTRCVKPLTLEKNPVERMRLADKIRGAKNALHTHNISILSNTSIDSKQ